MLIVDASPSSQTLLTPQNAAVRLASKLNFWYSADALTVVSELVSGAIDLTGNNRNGFQNTAGNRLTYFVSDSMFGGKPSFGSIILGNTQHLAAPVGLTYRHQIFSCYYKDGLDTTFDTFTTFSTAAGSTSLRLQGNAGSANLNTGGYSSGTISKGGAAQSATVLPLPASVLTANGNATFDLEIGGATANAPFVRVLVGAFRHFVGASVVLTTEEVQLIEGVIAWSDGTQERLISSHPYRTNFPV